MIQPLQSIDMRNRISLFQFGDRFRLLKLNGLLMITNTPGYDDFNEFLLVNTIGDSIKSRE